MGILRTNTVSGIETPTPVTGSVVFDGSGDYLTLSYSNTNFDWWTASFTIEAWVYASSWSGSSFFPIVGNMEPTSSSNNWALSPLSTGALRFYYYNGGGVIINSTGTLPTSQWNHIAVTHSSSTIRLFINGVLDTTTTVSGTPQSSNAIPLVIGQYNNISANGYISNLRILKGTALYTSNFTPPTRELQPIGDTVLLCCNNPDSAGAEATGKTITVNGNAAASTFSPGLVRDFTYGTQFDGVTKFDTQGYFVPPSGNTQNRYTLGLDEIVTSGLVLHLDAGNPLSYPVTGVGTHWNDLSGNNNRGVLYNGVSYTDNNRGALVFDGTNDYVDFFAEGLTTIATVEMWANNVIPTLGMFFGWNFYNVAGWNSRLGYNTGNLDLYGISAAECTRLNVSNSNIWNHYVFEMRSDVSYTNNKIYINGVSQSLSQLEGTENASGRSFNSGYGRISSWKLNLDYPIRMNCPVFKVYNRVLTSAEILQNYNALKGRYGHS